MDIIVCGLVLSIMAVGMGCSGAVYHVVSRHHHETRIYSNDIIRGFECQSEIENSKTLRLFIRHEDQTWHAFDTSCVFPVPEI